MKSISTRIFTGLLIMTVGVLLLLSNLGFTGFETIIHDWWPLLIIVVGALVLINDVGNFLWAILIMAVGTIIQLNHLNIADIDVWQLVWPVIIIVVGLSIMLNRAGAKHKVSKSERDDFTAVLSGSKANVQSKDFKGSKVTAVMGGAVVDLRHAIIKKEATLDVFSLWGGIEVYVPKDIIVKNNTSVILGGVEDTTDNSVTLAGAPVLYIIGDVIMAGVEIKN